MPRLDLILVLLLLASPLAAGPLPGMAGAWAGSGTARETPDSPAEAVRCRLDNDWQADRSRLRVRGRCAVAGRTFEIDGVLAAAEDGKLSGFWRNPRGPEQTSISGQTRDGTAYFTFRATDPATRRTISQIISLQIRNDQLHLTARSRDENSQMADILFKR